MACLTKVSNWRLAAQFTQALGFLVGVLMKKVKYELIIDAPPKQVFEVSQDYSIRHLWDPFPERIELLDGKKSISKGVKALVVAKNGLKMVVEFIQVSERHTAIKMIKGPFYLSSFAGSWVFKEYDCKTKAVFVYSIGIKKYMFPVFAEKIAAIYFTKEVKKRLDGLKKYCEFSLTNGSY